MPRQDAGVRLRVRRFATKGRNRRVWLSTILAGLVVASSAHVALPGASADSTIPNFDHIFVIVMENKPQSGLNPTQTPYLESLAASGAELTQSFAVGHPSLPNYLALTGASTFGLTIDCNTCYVGAMPNIVTDRIEPSGRSWKAYMESMPSSCYLADTSLYAVRHDPFVYYDQIRTDPNECNKVTPYSQLATDLSSTATTPSFGWITPNLCDDAHDCSITTGDTWLSTNVPALLASPAFTTQRSLLVVTFDEDDYSDNNNIPTILVGSGITPGTQSSAPYDHYSVLKTIENAWSLATLTTNDAAASPMADVFASSSSSSTTVPAGGGAIVARGSASSAVYESDGSTALKLSVPAGAQVGDVLVASLGFGKSAATVQPTLTAPPGWTLVRRTNLTTVAAVAVFTHVLSAGETSFTWTTSVTVGGAIFMAAFGGVDPVNPVDVSGGQTSTAVSTTYSAPSVTTTVANDMLVASFFAWRNGAHGTSWTPPVGMTELGDASNTTSRFGELDAAVQSAAGASGVKTATASAAANHAVATLTALRPAAG